LAKHRRQLASRAPQHYADAETDGATGESDRNARNRYKPLKNNGEIVSAVMQRLQGRLALAQLALHLQHEYLAVIEAQCFYLEQN
jgi:hypothetical protein